MCFFLYLVMEQIASIQCAEWADLKHLYYDMKMAHHSPTSHFPSLDHGEDSALIANHFVLDTFWALRIALLMS